MHDTARQRAWGWFWVGLWLALAGCPKATIDEGAVLQAGLDSADLAWRARGNRRVGFDGAEAALDRIPAAFADDPEVRWRRARLWVGRGLSAASEHEARRHFATARAAALGCLLLDEEVAAAEREHGWERASEAVPTGSRVCALWAAVAWTRWMVAFGMDAAAVDLPNVDALLRAGDEPLDQERHDLAQWTKGLLLAARPHPHGRDLRQGRALLEEALVRSATMDDGTPWVRWRDMERWAELSHSAPTPATEPFTPEDRASAGTQRPNAAGTEARPPAAE